MVSEKYALGRNKRSEVEDKNKIISKIEDLKK